MQQPPWITERLAHTERAAVAFGSTQTLGITPEAHQLHRSTSQNAVGASLLSRGSAPYAGSGVLLGCKLSSWICFRPNRRGSVHQSAAAAATEQLGRLAHLPSDQCSSFAEAAVQVRSTAVSQFVEHRRPNSCAFVGRRAVAVNKYTKARGMLEAVLSTVRAPIVLPNPSLHRKDHSRLQRLRPSGELKR